MSRDTHLSTEVWRRAEAIRNAVAGDPLYLTLLANLTTLSGRCQFALGADSALAARYLDLPFAAVSFYGAGPGLCEALSKLLEADEPCYALLGAEQHAQLASVARVLAVHQEWQMIYRGDPAILDVGRAVALGTADLEAMRALAVRGETMAFEANALEKGPYFGVWRDGRLVSMAGTHLELEEMVEIGNVVTDPDYRRCGLASMAVAAVTRALCAKGLLVLLQVFQSNAAAIALYERLGYERSRAMYLVRFAL